MTPRLFFYGTLMAGFERRRTAGVEADLRFVGRGSVAGRLYDLGDYPAAVPAADGRVWGEVYESGSVERVLPVLDAIEGAVPDDPAAGLYVRRQAVLTLADGTTADAWVYFYNGPIDDGRRIRSGDYRRHLASGPGTAS